MEIPKKPRELPDVGHFPHGTLDFLAEDSDEEAEETPVTVLDKLLERYLHTLHEYEKVMRELSQELSSGYFSLTKANFHNSSSAIRYGQDCYDERMQVIRKVHITGPTGKRYQRAYFAVLSETKVKARAQQEEQNWAYLSRATKEQRQSQLQQQLSDASELGTRPPEAIIGDSELPQAPGDTTQPSDASVPLTDPLKWFGILVPPALRTAQATFIGAVEGPVAQLATLRMELRNQEIEIGRQRKDMRKM